MAIENPIEGNLPPWEGDWENGERPEGYQITAERYSKLHEKGFSATKLLGEEFVKKQNEITAKAKFGFLQPNELKTLLFLNKTLIKAMDLFEDSSA